MIILIGGVGYAGKTLMAQRLLEKYHIPYQSIDHLKMGLYRANPDCGFTPYDSQEVIGEKLWPILKGIIMTNIENKQTLIIEGVYLLPHKIMELGDEYLKSVVTFYLGFSKAYVQKYFQSKIIEHRCAIEARGYDDSDTFEEYIHENENQKKLCGDYGAMYFEISHDYTQEIEKVYDWLDDEIHRK